MRRVQLTALMAVVIAVAMTPVDAFLRDAVTSAMPRLDALTQEQLRAGRHHSHHHHHNIEEDHDAHQHGAWKKKKLLRGSSRQFEAQQQQPAATTVAGGTLPPHTTVAGETLPPRTTGADGQTLAPPPRTTLEGQSMPPMTTLEGQTMPPRNGTAGGGDDVGGMQQPMMCNVTTALVALAELNRRCTLNFVMNTSENRKEFFAQGHESDPTKNVTAIRKLCMPACIGFLTNMTTQRGVSGCFKREEAAGYRAMSELCRPVTATSSVSCFEQIRWMDNYTCEGRDGRPNPQNETACRGMNPYGTCYWKSETRTTSSGSTYVTGRCESRFNASHLTNMCTPCLDRLAGVMKVVDPKQDATEFRFNVGMLCGKVGDTFCFPQLESAPFDRLFNFGGNLSNVEQLRADIASQCGTSTRKRCLTMSFNGMLAAETYRLRKEFTQCASMFNASRDDRDFKDSVERHCLNSYTSRVRDMQKNEQLLRLMCTKNANNQWCLEKQHVLARHRCAQELHRGMPCNAQCDAWVQNFTAGAGCCMRQIEEGDYRRAEQVPQEKVPIVKRTNTSSAVEVPTNQTASAFNGQLSSSSVFRNWTQCPSQNNSLFEQKVGRKCAGRLRPAPVKRYGVPGLRWSAIANNPTLRTKIINGLTTDIATALGVLEASIQNKSLVENSGRSVSRRQTSSGVDFQFQVDSDSDADADSLSAAFDTLVSSGTLTITSTATVISSECTNCTAAGVDLLASATLAPETTTVAPGQTTTAGPTTAPAGGDQTTLPGGLLSSSTASASTSLLAVAAATFAALVALV